MTAMARWEPFDWLASPYCRRSALRDVEKAIRAGRLDGPENAARREALCRRLTALMDDPALKPRELFRLVRIMVAIDGRILDAERRILNAEIRSFRQAIAELATEALDDDLVSDQAAD